MKALILGITFKENCPDIRNSKVIDLINEIKKYGIETYTSDPVANRMEVEKTYDICLSNSIPYGEKFDITIFAVSRDSYKNIEIEEINRLLNPDPIIFNVKGILPNTINAIKL